MCSSMCIKPQIPLEPQHSLHASKISVFTNSCDQSEDAGGGGGAVGVVGGGGGGGAGGAALGEMEVCMCVHFQVVASLVL
jgi:hypothetical protein